MQTLRIKACIYAVAKLISLPLGSVDHDERGGILQLTCLSDGNHATVRQCNGNILL
jgi:hypothetical protein